MQTLLIGILAALILIMVVLTRIHRNIEFLAKREEKKMTAEDEKTMRELDERMRFEAHLSSLFDSRPS